MQYPPRLDKEDMDRKWRLNNDWQLNICILWIRDTKDFIDWSKVNVDTKILVSRRGDKWIKRYFSRYVDGVVYAFVGGSTSFSSETEDCDWAYAKLYREGYDD